MRDHFLRLFEHVRWADARVLDLLSTSPATRQPQVMRILSHLLAAERVWLLRLRGEDAASQPIWPELSLEEIQRLGAENTAGYARLLAEIGDERLASRVTYANSAGVVFQTVVSDILTHVALHGSYHRGQVASMVRAAGAEPANTDFITFARGEDGVAAPAVGSTVAGSTVG